MSDEHKDLKAAEKDFEDFLDETFNNISKDQKREHIKQFLKGFKNAYGKGDEPSEIFRNGSDSYKEGFIFQQNGESITAAQRYGAALGFMLYAFEYCAKFNINGPMMLGQVKEVAELMKKNGHKLKHSFLKHRIEHVAKEYGRTMNDGTKDFLKASAKMFV